jgi:electron transport complex protein RnfB
MKNISATDIDSILPQTQCGLCGYKGCKPYAEALANNKAEINLCPPGGVKGLLTLAELLNKNPEPFVKEMQATAKPVMRAVIREEECIGCTKCIKACPVDAILGSGKLMHTVITDECTGCELCIAPCPVDCIDMVASSDNADRKTQYRDRYQARQKRLDHDSLIESDHSKIMTTQTSKQDYIRAALERAKKKSI